MFKNHNDLNIDEIDIVQIEENRKKGKKWKSNNDKKKLKKLLCTIPIFLSANFHTYFNTISIISHTKYLILRILTFQQW